MDLIVVIAIFGLGATAALRALGGKLANGAERTGDAVLAIASQRARSGDAASAEVGNSIPSPVDQPGPSALASMQMQPSGERSHAKVQVDKLPYAKPLSLPQKPVVVRAPGAFSPIPKGVYPPFVLDEAPDFYAERAIQAGDDLLGSDKVDTPLEEAFLQRWLQGDGSPYYLSAADMQLVRETPQAQLYGDYIRAHGSSLESGPAVDMGLNDGSTLSRVTLADGSPGFKVEGRFGAETAGDALNGSIGKGNGYFNEQGELVGILDTYDFSNDSIEVAAIDTLGGVPLVQAHNFAVSGGLVERDRLSVGVDRPAIMTPPDDPGSREEILPPGYREFRKQTWGP